MLISDFDPAAIAREVQEHESTLDKLRSRKSRSWDAFDRKMEGQSGEETAGRGDRSLYAAFCRLLRSR